MPTAAYCNTCRTFVFVNEDECCINGHPRSNLRDIHEADVDRRTGGPKRRRTSRVERLMAMPAPAPRVEDVSELREPQAPIPAVYCDVAGGPYDVPGVLTRMFGGPKGRHSRTGTVAISLELGDGRAVMALSLALVMTAVLIGYMAGAGQTLAAHDLLSLLTL